MMDYKNLLWPQWRTALLQLTIYRRTFWTDYMIVLATNLCRMLMIETTILANLVSEPEAKRMYLFRLQLEYFRWLLGHH